jgi:hypothetical protein
MLSVTKGIACAVVVFNLAPTFLGDTWRHYSWMLDGLEEGAWVV